MYTILMFDVICHQAFFLQCGFFFFSFARRCPCVFYTLSVRKSIQPFSFYLLMILLKWLPHPRQILFYFIFFDEVCMK